MLFTAPTTALLQSTLVATSLSITTDILDQTVCIVHSCNRACITILGAVQTTLICPSCHHIASSIQEVSCGSRALDSLVGAQLARQASAFSRCGFLGVEVAACTLGGVDAPGRNSVGIGLACFGIFLACTCNLLASICNLLASTCNLLASTCNLLAWIGNLLAWIGKQQPAARQKKR